MAENPILFLLFAGNCGHCVKLKKEWTQSQLPAELKKEFTIIQRDVADFNTQLRDPTLPYHVSNSVPHFPMMGVFPANAWKMALADTSKPYHLNGELYNMDTQLDGRFTSMKPARYHDYNLNTIKSWALQSKGVVLHRPMPTIQPSQPVVKEHDLFCARRVANIRAIKE